MHSVSVLAFSWKANGLIVPPIQIWMIACCRSDRVHTNAGIPASALLVLRAQRRIDFVASKDDRDWERVFHCPKQLQVEQFLSELFSHRTRRSPTAVLWGRIA